jgi:glutamine synthetase
VYGRALPERSLNTERPLPFAAAEEAIIVRLPHVSRREQLRRELLTSVESLARRRADLISEGFIEDYVALHWLEWHAGALRLTPTGTSMCEHLRTRMP